MIKGGRIRKLIIWQISPTQQISYSVGTGDVLSIEDDQEYFQQHKQRRFLVFKKNEAGDAVLWKEISNMPVIVEYNISHESNKRQNFSVGASGPGRGQD